MNSTSRTLFRYLSPSMLLALCGCGGESSSPGASAEQSALQSAATSGVVALKVLQKPGDVFVRLHSMRRILERDSDDGEILALLARTYIKLGVRGEEAVRIATQLAKLRPGSASEQLLKEARTR